MSDHDHAGAVDDATLQSLIREFARLVRRHPRLTRAVVASLAAEGKAYAQTREGARLRERMLRSPRVRRAWVLWDTFGLARAGYDPDGFEPSWWIRTVATLTASDRLDALVWRFLMEEDAP